MSSIMMDARTRLFRWKILVSQETVGCDTYVDSKHDALRGVASKVCYDGLSCSYSDMVVSSGVAMNVQTRQE